MQSPVVKPFRDMLDEEYAKELEESDIRQEEEHYLEQVKQLSLVEAQNHTSPPHAAGDQEVPVTPGVVDNNIATSPSVDTTDSDLMLARMLQMEFDRENDQHIRSLEKNMNGSQKVSMNYKKYYSHQGYEDVGRLCYADSSEESDDYLNDNGDDDVEEEDVERKPSGRVKHGNEIITKHDSIIAERKNLKKIQQFTTEFAVGDVAGGDKVRLPNHVFNKLKLHSMKEEKSDIRLHEKQEHATYEKALDEQTRLLLYKMVNNGTLDSLEGIIATGKESVLIYAKAHQDEGTLPTEYALKVYKTTLNEFKTREKYIREDHRFRERYQKQNPRKIIRLWAEKEFRNLQRMDEAGIPCPKAVLLRKHIVVLSFIGGDSSPAPKLKDAPLNKTQLNQAYLQCIGFMKTLYEKCNLIHGDFSEYNVLWHDSKCIFIDVSQSVEPTHAQAFHFLHRDCRNITRFFKKSGLVSDMKSVEELFTFVCGKDISGASLDQLENECKENFEANEEMLVHGMDSKNFAFDYHFKQSENNGKKNADQYYEQEDEDEVEVEDEGVEG